MTYFLLFLYNLKFPFAAATVMGIFTALWVAARNIEIRDKTEFGSLENKDARWAIMMSLQSTILLVAFTCILWAVPSPTYDVKIVEKKVYVPKPYPVIKWTKGKQIVRMPSNYSQTFNNCINSYSYRTDTTIIGQCHKQALEASKAK